MLVIVNLPVVIGAAIAVLTLVFILDVITRDVVVRKEHKK